MPQKNILNLIYAPTALCLMSVGDAPTYKSQTTLSPLADKPESLEVISEIVSATKNPKAVVRALKKLKHLMHDEIPLSFRPELFKAMNQVVKVLFENYPRSQDVFAAAFQTLTALKEQIDKTPQTATTLAELEWVELEKAVYLLCNWEDGLEAMQS